MPPHKFVCRFPGCRAEYRRKEHLVRHETQHSQPQSFQCPACSREFRRSDSLRRHMRTIHEVNAPTHTKHACAHCRKTKSRCQGGSPCSECRRRQIHCSLDRQLVEAPSSPRGAKDVPCSGAGRSDPGRRFLDLYFDRFHPYWLFLHRASFNEEAEPPLLVQAMIVIGLWMSKEPNARSAAINLHNNLASAISEQMEAWDVSATEDVGDASWPIPLYQGILLHIIFAIMHTGAGDLGIDLKPSLSHTNTNILNALVESCKRRGMLYYPTILAQSSQSGHIQYIWLCIEEIKRFNLALYRVCRAVSQAGQRATDTGANQYVRLTAKDLQFPLPNNTALWEAVSKEDWHSAAEKGVFDHVLHDTMDEKWISKVNEALGASWELDYLLHN